MSAPIRSFSTRARAAHWDTRDLVALCDSGGYARPYERFSGRGLVAGLAPPYLFRGASVTRAFRVLNAGDQPLAIHDEKAAGVIDVSGPGRLPHCEPARS